MNGDGIHLYCFARAGQPLEVATVGVAGDAVCQLHRGRVTAVFSRVPLAEFASEAGERNLRDPAWVIPRVRQHDSVVEEVMRTAPVLPVPFGALLGSEGELAGLVTQRHGDIDRFLERMTGREEWVVKGFVDIRRVRAHLDGTPALAPSETSGPRLLAAQRRRADEKRKVRNWCRALAAEIHDELRREAVDFKALETRADGSAQTNVRMVLNCALLLDRGRVEPFCRRAEHLKTVYAEYGLTVAFSGPRPPYAFAPAIVGAPPPVTPPMDGITTKGTTYAK